MQRTFLWPKTKARGGILKYGKILVTLFLAAAANSFATRFPRGYQCWGKFSPDGKKIAFERYGGGEFGIYVINADGSGERLLGPGGRQPRFSPMRVDGVLLDTYGRVIGEETGAAFRLGKRDVNAGTASSTLRRPGISIDAMRRGIMSCAREVSRLTQEVFDDTD
jgi:hypothetical protein